MKGEMMLPNTQKCTVLSVSGGIQGVMGKQEVGNAEKNARSFGMFKKMTARSGWDDQIRVFLHPRYENYPFLDYPNPHYRITI